MIVVALLAGSAGCGTIVDTWHWSRLQVPAWSGQQACTPMLDVEPHAPQALCASLVEAIAEARRRVERTYGSVTTSPRVHAFRTEDAYRRSGGGVTIAKTYGGQIILSPRGLNAAFIAHEWSHVELHHRLTLAGWTRMPTWFDEGIAVAVSDAPETNEDHWKWLAEQGIPRPSRDELMSLRTTRQWIDAIRDHGEDRNIERVARGEPPRRPVYTAAGHELRRWLSGAGTTGLLRIVDALNSDDDFDAAYRQADDAASR